MARFGLLIDPKKRRVHIYRRGRRVQILEAPHTVACDPVLPGFILDLRESGRQAFLVGSPMTTFRHGGRRSALSLRELKICHRSHKEDRLALQIRSSMSIQRTSSAISAGVRSRASLPRSFSVTGTFAAFSRASVILTNWACVELFAVPR